MTESMRRTDSRIVFCRCAAVLEPLWFNVALVGPAGGGALCLAICSSSPSRKSLTTSQDTGVFWSGYRFSSQTTWIASWAALSFEAATVESFLDIAEMNPTESSWRMRRSSTLSSGVRSLRSMRFITSV